MHFDKKPKSIAYELGLDEYADYLAQDGIFVDDYTDPEDYNHEEN